MMTQPGAVRDRSEPALEAPPATVPAAARFLSFPLDVDAIARRAEAAPAGCWEAFPDSLWIPWHADGDDETDGHWSSSGRWIALQEHGWHTGSEDPGSELWAFLAAARDDVLTLAAEVRRLRAELASPSRKVKVAA
jgi:hypothetical protein